MTEFSGKGAVITGAVAVVGRAESNSVGIYYALEDLGLVGRGEEAAFIGEGNTRPGGSLPTNTNGGGSLRLPDLR